MNHFNALKFIRHESKKNGLTFSRQENCFNQNGEPVYLFNKRKKTGIKVIHKLSDTVRHGLTLGIAFEIACSGELELYK